MGLRVETQSPLAARGVHAPRVRRQRRRDKGRRSCREPFPVDKAVPDSECLSGSSRTDADFARGCGIAGAEHSKGRRCDCLLAAVLALPAKERVQLDWHTALANRTRCVQHQFPSGSLKMRSRRAAPRAAASASAAVELGTRSHETHCGEWRIKQGTAVRLPPKAPLSPPPSTGRSKRARQG